MNVIHVGYADRIGWLSYLEAIFKNRQEIYYRQCKKWNRAEFQVKLLEAKTDHLKLRYNYAVEAGKKHFSKSLRLQLATVEGVLEMFRIYEARLDDELTSFEFENNANLDEIRMLRRYSIAGIPRDGINPHPVDQTPRHRGSYSQVAAMDPPSQEATAAHSPEATTVHHPIHEVASTHLPCPEVASSIHLQCPEVSSTHHPIPEVASSDRPCPEGEGSDGGWSIVQRRKKGKKCRQQPHQQDQQSE